jgi:hypothetical protein
MKESKNTEQQIDEELEKLGIDVSGIYQYKIIQSKEEKKNIKYEYLVADSIYDAYKNILRICKIRKIEWFQIIDVAPIEVCYVFRR